MTVNKRKYARVFLTKGIQDFEKIIGIDVEWPGAYKTGVLDISYIGAAILKSTKDPKRYEKGERLDLKFYFSGQKDFQKIKATVVREDEKLVAFSFEEVETNTREALQKFLKEKMVGLNTRLVNPKYYHKEQKFDFWFHGPNETNIYVWGDQNSIQKSTIEIDFKVLTLENDRIFFSTSSTILKVPTEDYSYQVNFPDKKEEIKKNHIHVKYALSLLSQIEDPSGVIEKVIKKLI